jgi:hypothetical protein
MEAGKFSFKFSHLTQKNLVGSSKYAYFSRYDFDQYFRSGGDTDASILDGVKIVHI